MPHKLSWTHWWEHMKQMWLVYGCGVQISMPEVGWSRSRMAPLMRKRAASMHINWHLRARLSKQRVKKLLGWWLNLISGHNVVICEKLSTFLAWNTIHCIHLTPNCHLELHGTASLMFIAPCFASLCVIVVVHHGSSSSKNGAFRHRTRWPWRFSATVPVGRFGKRMKRMAVGFKWILSKKRDQAVMIYIEISMISTVPTARAPSHQTKLGLAVDDVDVLFDFLAPKIGIIHNSTKSSQIISPKKLDYPRLRQQPWQEFSSHVVIDTGGESIPMVSPKCLEKFGNFLDPLQVVTWILQPSLALSWNFQSGLEGLLIWYQMGIQGVT